MSAGQGGTSTRRRRGGLWFTRVLSIGSTGWRGQPEPWSTPKEMATRGFLRQPRRLQGLAVGAEPAESHGEAVPHRPDVAVLAPERNAAPAPRGAVVRQHYHV